MRLLYDNETFNATITASSEDPNKDTFSTALNDTRLSRKAQTVTDTAQWIKFAYSSSVDVNYVMILGHNISETANIQIEGSTIDEWDTSTNPEFVAGFTRYEGVLVAEFDTETYQYWRLYIDDPSNTDGYIQISYVYIGDHLEIARMGHGKKIPRKSNALVEESESGQSYGSKKIQWLEATINVPLIEEAKKSEIDTYFIDVDIVRPFILIVWEDDMVTEPPIYCRLTKDLDWQEVETENVVHYWKLGISIKEVK